MAGIMAIAVMLVHDEMVVRSSRNQEMLTATIMRILASAVFGWGRTQGCDTMSVTRSRYLYERLFIYFVNGSRPLSQLEMSAVSGLPLR